MAGACLGGQRGDQPGVDYSLPRSRLVINWVPSTIQALAGIAGNDIASAQAQQLASSWRGCQRLAVDRVMRDRAFRKVEESCNCPKSNNSPSHCSSSYEYLRATDEVINSSCFLHFVSCELYQVLWI